MPLPFTHSLYIPTCLRQGWMEAEAPLDYPRTTRAVSWQVGLCVSLSHHWGGVGRGGGVCLRPHTPGARPQIRGSFRLGSHPRPFHNSGKSAELRVPGYGSPCPHSSPSQAPWGERSRPCCRSRVKRVSRSEREARGFYAQHCRGSRAGVAPSSSLTDHLQALTLQGSFEGWSG